MIQFKSLVKEVHNVETLSQRDIFNFYYLWHTASHSPELVSTAFGKEVLNYYLQQMKTKYVRLFKKVLLNQIQKYKARRRVDNDFPMDKPDENSSASELQFLMKKTFRSDMKTRNEKWDMVAAFVSNLTAASSNKDIFLWINQLNNAVHNTNSKVMDKFPNFHTELNRAFDTVAKATNIEALKGMVDKDIRDLKNQTEAEPMQNENFSEAYGVGLQKIIFTEATEEDQKDFESGKRSGLKDKLSGNSRDLEKHSSAFVKGYKFLQGKSAWNSFNNKITDFVTRMGSSYGTR
jgi:hypothetical protein